MLWGGTPKNIRGIYTVSILISALSFMIVSVFVILKVQPLYLF